MKIPLQHAIVSISIFFIGNCIAQPVLDSANSAPSLGESFSTNNCNYVAPGSSGANATWDLSSFVAISVSASSTDTVSKSFYAPAFPNATVISESSGNLEFYFTSSNLWQNQGIVSAAGVVFNYSNYEDLLHFPFTYPDTYTDQFAATFTSNGYQYKRSGSVTVTADAYGTLLLPGLTLSNILRVHLVETYQDSTFIDTPFIIPYINDEYMYYLPGLHQPVAAVYTLTISGSASTAGYYSISTTGIKEESALVSFNLFPNPSSDNLAIQMSLSENKKICIKVFNTLGQPKHGHLLFQNKQPVIMVPRTGFEPARFHATPSKWCVYQFRHLGPMKKLFLFNYF
jgi:hypothetical protein